MTDSPKSIDEILEHFGVPKHRAQILERATFDQHALEKAAKSMRERCPVCGEMKILHPVAPWCLLKYPDGPP